jgi:hypothetical protein
MKKLYIIAGCNGAGKNIMETKDQLKEERDKIVKGLEETYKKLVEFKKSNNSSFVVVKNGEIVEIDPNDVPPTISYKRSQG